MTIKIRLKRVGKKHKPYYNIIISNSTSPRNGKFLEKIGTYDPILNNSYKQKHLTLNIKKLKYWLKNGAKPTKRVKKCLTQYNIIY